MYLTWNAITLPCAVNPERTAILSPKFRSYVNHEVYFFSDTGAMKRFKRDPLKYCGTLTDPVSKVRFRPGKKSPHTTFMDRPYFFSSDSTAAVFASMPDSFAVRRGM